MKVFKKKDKIIKQISDLCQFYSLSEEVREGIIKISTNAYIVGLNAVHNYYTNKDEKK